MNPSDSTLLDAKFDHQKTASSLRVAALYGGLANLIFAQGALASLALSVRPNMQIHSHLWSFDALTRLDVRHASIPLAGAADVIIIAAAASAPLPAQLKSWITQCLRENRHSVPVIVGIFEQENHAQTYAVPTLRRELAAIASQWRLPLLCNREFDAYLERGLAAELAGQGTLQSRSHSRSHFDLESLLATPRAGRWGINE